MHLLNTVWIVFWVLLSVCFNVFISYRRVEAEHLADLKQEKFYLETQVGNLECDLQQANIVKEGLQAHMDKLQQNMTQVCQPWTWLIPQLLILYLRNTLAERGTSEHHRKVSKVIRYREGFFLFCFVFVIGFCFCFCFFVFVLFCSDLPYTKIQKAEL